MAITKNEINKRIYYLRQAIEEYQKENPTPKTGDMRYDLALIDAISIIKEIQKQYEDVLKAVNKIIEHNSDYEEKSSSYWDNYDINTPEMGI